VFGNDRPEGENSPSGMRDRSPAVEPLEGEVKKKKGALNFRVTKMDSLQLFINTII
jgi:hypothetical protein